MVKNLFGLTESEIKIELASIQAWLEKAPKSKKWTERGFKAGVINWFKKYTKNKPTKKVAGGEIDFSQIKTNEQNKILIAELKARIDELTNKMDVFRYALKESGLKSREPEDIIKTLAEMGFDPEEVRAWINWEYWEEIDRLENKIRDLLLGDI